MRTGPPRIDADHVEISFTVAPGKEKLSRNQHPAFERSWQV
jgi:hypothetical protein